MQRLIKRRTNTNKMSGRPLDNNLFSTHISNMCQNEDNWRPGKVFFTCLEDMRSAIRDAIEKAPTTKAPGVDQVKSEMLKIDNERITELLLEWWKACGRCGTLPRPWLKALLAPLHKKVEQHNTRNYRPSSLLSHARKTIKSAIDILLRNTYSKNALQLGFQKGKSTKRAILRATEL